VKGNLVYSVRLSNGKIKDGVDAIDFAARPDNEAVVADWRAKRKFESRVQRLSGKLGPAPAEGKSKKSASRKASEKASVPKKTKKRKRK